MEFGAHHAILLFHHSQKMEWQRRTFYYSWCTSDQSICRQQMSPRNITAH